MVVLKESQSDELQKKLTSLLKELVTSAEDTDFSKINDIPNDITEKIVKWCEKYKNNGETLNRKAELTPWNLNFVKNIDRDTLFALIKSCYDIHLYPFLDVLCKSLAMQMSGKTAAQIREQFSIGLDLTIEEQTKICNENPWCRQKFKDGEIEIVDPFEASSPLDKFSDDLLCRILNHVTPVASKMRLVLVSRRFSDCLEQQLAWQLHETLNIRLEKVLTTTQMEEKCIFLSIAPIKRLELVLGHFSEKRFINLSEKFSKLDELLRQITSISITFGQETQHPAVEMFFWLLENCPNIQELQLQITELMEENRLWILVGRCEKLEKLTVKNSRTDFDLIAAMTGKKIKELHLEMESLAAEDLIHITSRIPVKTLEKLVISKNYIAFDLVKLVSQAKSGTLEAVKYLELREQPRFPYDLVEMLQKLPQLKQFRFGGAIGNNQKTVDLLLDLVTKLGGETVMTIDLRLKVDDDFEWVFDTKIRTDRWKKIKVKPNDIKYVISYGKTVLNLELFKK